MSDKLKRQIEQELKLKRGFDLSGAIMDQGGGLFKDASIVPRLQQVQMELILFVRSHTPDSSGALYAVLEQVIRENDVILAQNLNSPKKALSVILEHILANEDSLIHFVRSVDQEYGRLYNEKPFFQKKGQAAHPDDEYTHESVARVLVSLTQKIREAS